MSEILKDESLGLVLRGYDLVPNRLACYENRRLYSGNNREYFNATS